MRYPCQSLILLDIQHLSAKESSSKSFFDLGSNTADLEYLESPTPLRILSLVSPSYHLDTAPAHSSRNSISSTCMQTRLPSSPPRTNRNQSLRPRCNSGSSSRRSIYSLECSIYQGVHSSDLKYDPHTSSNHPLASSALAG